MRYDSYGLVIKGGPGSGPHAGGASREYADKAARAKEASKKAWAAQKEADRYGGITRSKAAVAAHQRAERAHNIAFHASVRAGKNGGYGNMKHDHAALAHENAAARQMSY
jgi:hypothetical protein